MKKAVLFGATTTTKNIIYSAAYLDGAKPVAIVANNDDSSVGKSFMSVPIISTDDFFKLGYDKCDVFFLGMKDANELKAVYGFLTDKLHIDESNILTFDKARNALLLKVLDKYSQMTDVSPDISAVIMHWCEHKSINIYGSYSPPEGIYHTVTRDKDNWPFIDLEGKKMYFPKEYILIERTKSGGERIRDILIEQHEHSPHLYIRDKNEIPNGAVIVDAGVCEGNFALRYVERAKKIYLIEPDATWHEPLERTFAPWRDKVVLVKKMLTSFDSWDAVTLDTIIGDEGCIDFLKMDVEGAEIDALLGGKKVLARSDARLAVAAYHRQNDAANIKFILSALGYETLTSEGYMFFPYDKNSAYSLDLRRGIVYGKKAR